MHLFTNFDLSEKHSILYKNFFSLENIKNNLIIFRFKVQISFWKTKKIKNMKFL